MLERDKRLVGWLVGVRARVFGENDGGDTAHIRCDKQWIGEDRQHHNADQQDLQGRDRSWRYLPQRHSGSRPANC